MYYISITCRACLQGSWIWFAHVVKVRWSLKWQEVHGRYLPAFVIRDKSNAFITSFWTIMKIETLN